LPARYTQGIAAFARITSKVLVNGDSNKVVNIASTKMMKKVFTPSSRHSGARIAQTSDVQLHIGESRDSGFDASHRPGMTTEFHSKMPGTSPGMTPSWIIKSRKA
jgi:hypothetical protein